MVLYYSFDIFESAAYYSMRDRDSLSFLLLLLFLLLFLVAGTKLAQLVILAAATTAHTSKRPLQFKQKYHSWFKSSSILFSIVSLPPSHLSFNPYFFRSITLSPAFLFSII